LAVKNLAIGMFDSGIGGLTVLKEVMLALPHEHIIYLGDTARVPYGNRSPETVTRYSLENAYFLLSKGIKMLVVACNTSSAIALPVLKKKLPIPVIGVIDPPSEEAVSKTKTGKIGVIGTRATISSNAYVKAIRKRNPSVEVISKACPLFVPIVEEGLETNEIARVAVRMYLEDFTHSGIDVLVMGCTHYPILEAQIRQYLGLDLYIVNTGRQTSRHIEESLVALGAIKRTGKGRCDFFVTDAPDKVSDLGSRVLQAPLPKVRLVRSLEISGTASCS
jgi:glutamate racemase